MDDVVDAEDAVVEHLGMGPLRARVEKGRLVLDEPTSLPDGTRDASRIHQLSDDVLRVEEGSLYPALYRLEEAGLVESEWRSIERTARAKYYRLTRKGRAAADAELEGWIRLSRAVTKVLRAVEQGA